MAKIKRISAIFLAALIALGLSVMTGAQADAVPEGYITIATPADLDAVRNNLTGKYILTNDIDMAGWGNFTPIGARFQGVLDGGGFRIQNLSIGASLYGDRTVGLFERLTNAQILNLTLEDANVDTADIIVGAIAGEADNSVIRNCMVTGTVRNQTNASISSMAVGGIVGYAYRTQFEQLVFKGSVSNKGSRSFSVGGILGVANSSVQVDRCRFSGSIENECINGISYTGGIVGRDAWGFTLNRCESDGTLKDSSKEINAGGILGHGSTNVKDCVNRMDLDCRASYTVQAGGIVGNSGSASNCQNYGDVTVSAASASACGGGIVGKNLGGNITFSSNYGSITAERTFLYGDAPWVVLGGIIGDTRSTIAFCDNSGAVSFRDELPYEPTAANSAAGGIAGDGSGMKILYCSNSGPVTVALDNDRPSSRNLCAGIAANLSGFVHHSYNTGAVSAVGGKVQAGGIAAMMGSSQIDLCYNLGAVSASSAANDSIAGGIAATMGSRSRIYSAYHAGAVKAVSSAAKAFAGGLAGWITDTSGDYVAGNPLIHTGYYASDACAAPFGYLPEKPKGAPLQKYIGALSNAQMKQKAAFEGFDFTNEWSILAAVNNGMPTLNKPGNKTVAELETYVLPPIEIPPRPTLPPVEVQPELPAAMTLIYRSSRQLPSPGNGQTYDWKSDSKYITVDQNGKVTSLRSFSKLQSATITVTDQYGRWAKCQVRTAPTLQQWLAIIFLFGWIWM